MSARAAGAEPTGEGATWRAWVRWAAADAGVGLLSDEEIDFLLWERTAWPCAPAEHVKGQVRETLACLATQLS